MLSAMTADSIRCTEIRAAGLKERQFGGCAVASRHDRCECWPRKRTETRRRMHNRTAPGVPMGQHAIRFVRMDRVVVMPSLGASSRRSGLLARCGSQPWGALLDRKSPVVPANGDISCVRMDSGFMDHSCWPMVKSLREQGQCKQ